MISGEPCDKPSQRAMRVEGELVRGSGGSQVQSLFYLYLRENSVVRNRKSIGFLGKCYS